MRLGALFLITSALAAQEARGLPWDKAPNLPWRSVPSESLPSAEPLLPSTGPLKVVLNADGALKVIDERGIVRLRTGLPGRPEKVWRDGGIRLENPWGTWSFPAQSPLRSGIGALPLGQPDFRPGLQGLLWILDDEERILTVLHPATSRLAYLPLPAGTALALRFLPDQLVVQQEGDPEEARRSRSAWTLPWLSLLPQFILLGTPLPAPPPGTALVPFPKE